MQIVYRYSKSSALNTMYNIKIYNFESSIYFEVTNLLLTSWPMFYDEIF